jgi:hypothetical protein
MARVERGKGEGDGRSHGSKNEEKGTNCKRKSAILRAKSRVAGGFMRRFALAAALALVPALASLASAPLYAEEATSAEDAKIAAAAKVVQRSLDQWRARNFEGWIANFSNDVVVAGDGIALVNKSELRDVYKQVFDLKLPVPEILDSGWTGERVYVVQREFGPNGEEMATTYAEYGVRGGKITAVYGWAQ